MNPNTALSFAMEAGEIMLQNGAETYRVEDTMRRILENCNFEVCESFVATTGIFASVKNQQTDFITMVKRVRSRTNNFEKIALVNDVSRRFESGELNIENAHALLKQIKEKSPYKKHIKIIAAGVASLAFSLMFGGSFLESINSGLTGFMVQILVTYFISKNVSSVLVNVLTGFSIALFSIIFVSLGIGVNIDSVIIGAIMPFVPGVALTNSIRDILEGDYLSGTSRVMDACLVAVSLATGIGVVLKISIFMGGLNIF